MRIIEVFCASFIISSLVFGDQSYQPTEDNLRAREWFQDSKFGMFIVWGPYSVLEKGEWVMEKSKISIQDYEKLAVSQFNPTQVDPAAWVALAKEAGMKYITITSRHHDGFAMWKTRQDPSWNIVNATPFDPLKALADECHRQNIKLFFYYSQLDWHHSDYFPLGSFGHYSGRTQNGNFNQYLDFMDAQLRELLTGYGEVAGIWFDGIWDKPTADWRLKQTYSLIHQLQPATLIGGNHHLAPLDGEDFQMFEKDLPGQSTQYFNSESTPISSLPLETCETINESWGYDSSDKAYKTTKDLIHYLVKAAGNNANFLLDIGPRSDGTVQPEFIERLQEMGAWMKKNGESIYGTRGGPIKPMPWGIATHKEAHVYLHILTWQGTHLVIPQIGKIRSAKVWPYGPEVAIQEKESEYLLQIPIGVQDPIDTIIELEMQL